MGYMFYIFLPISVEEKAMFCQIVPLLPHLTIDPSLHSSCYHQFTYCKLLYNNLLFNNFFLSVWFGTTIEQMLKVKKIH